jgi:hypothetical protein
MAKTVKIAALVEKANAFLLNSVDSDIKGREAIHSLITSVLMDANAYKGFRYLEPVDMSDSLNGKTAGILFSSEGNHVYPDASRTRFYYAS